MATQPGQVFPTPVFEGSEKRIELDFFLGGDAPAAGLRAIPRQSWEEVLQLAGCCIVSSRCNDCVDAYVLSESSLFVYPSKVVLKTCGTTKLLRSVPKVLELAAEHAMLPRRCKYSRASFLFPEHQPEAHASFEVEARMLKGLFSQLGGGCSAYVLGDAFNGLQWHVFVAQAAPQLGEAPAPAPTYTLEVCMTGLDPARAAHFTRGLNFISAADTTAASGIAALLPGADIDDYVFEPCGYSMNGLEGAQFSTIHITPEEGFSYASVELCGYPGDSLDASALVRRVADMLRPAQLSVAMSVDASAPYCAWGASLAAPAAYNLEGACCQELRCGGRVAYFSLSRAPVAKGGSAPGSPRTVLHAAAASALTDFLHSGSDSDTDVEPKSVPAAATATVACTLQELQGGCDDGTHCEGGLHPLSDSVSSLLDAAAEAAPAQPAKPPAAPLSVAEVMAKYGAEAVAGAGGQAVLDAHLAQLIARHGLEDSFYLVDLGAVARLHAAWRAAMPRVAPYYAVKCNGNPGLVAMLAALGAGFDCASEAEVDDVLALGVAPGRIVYANACKRPSDIRAAAAKGVHLTTFDTASELQKVAAWHPGSRLLLRLRADDPGARCQLGNKYGTEIEDCGPLLRLAKQLGLTVVGVSFHVGSGATNPYAFREAIALARTVFDEGLALGFDMAVLDIGGGFCAGSFDATGRVDLGRVPEAVNAALARHFPQAPGLRIIAEPGRYFAEAAATLACQVFGRRVRGAPAAGGGGAGGTRSYDYWITDGLYGSMNCVLYDHAVLHAHALRSPLPPAEGQPAPAPEAPGGGAQERTFPSIVFGPTCDGLDVVLKDYPLPELRNGDWLVFPAMGAYTICGASDFNGIAATSVKTFYVRSAC